MNALSSHIQSFEVAPKASLGETVVFDRFDPDNSAWFFGRDSNGIEGYFAVGWFDICEKNRSAVALRDYDATELSIAVGTPVELEGEYGNWIVAVADGKRGWLPKRCIQHAEQDAAMKNQRKSE